MKMLSDDMKENIFFCILVVLFLSFVYTILCERENKLNEVPVKKRSTLDKTKKAYRV